jgi:hypothetical protein
MLFCTAGDEAMSYYSYTAGYQRGTELERERCIKAVWDWYGLTDDEKRIVELVIRKRRAMILEDTRQWSQEEEPGSPELPMRCGRTAIVFVQWRDSEEGDERFGVYYGDWKWASRREWMVPR